MSSESQSENIPKPETFSMVLIDLDDTLIPSRMYRLFANSFSIDIFELFSKTEMRKLQLSITETLEHIREHYQKSGECIEFCLVSNAMQKWLDFMFVGSKSHFISSRVPILQKYFEQNNIPIISAPATAHEFVQQKFGKKAPEYLAESKRNRWIMKYTAFASVIVSFQDQTNRKCKQIISIGDGNDELIALKQYSTTHKINSIHVRLLRGATINQLQNQWTYLKNSLLGTIHKNEKLLFYIYDLRKLDDFETDNIDHLTGEMDQLPAIQNYFQAWMDNLATVTVKDKSAAIESVCLAVHKRMYSLNHESTASKNLKLILIKAVCQNMEFSRAFNGYFLKVQRESEQQKKKEMKLASEE